MKITEQERQNLSEMTIALSEFLNNHKLDLIIEVYHDLVARLKSEDFVG